MGLLLKRAHLFILLDMIEVKKYDLPDINIFYDESVRNGHTLWVPDDYYIVLGNSNKPFENLIEQSIFADNVWVYKRPSGGETVILSPNTLVLAIKSTLDKFSNPNRHFRYFNQKIIQGLESLEIKGLSTRGISDIALEKKKILGSSIYRKRNVLFYHAVLNVSEPVETIERYIKHPTKEPDYRKGRSHKEFVTSLHDEGYVFTMHQIQDALNTSLSSIDESEVLELSS